MTDLAAKEGATTITLGCELSCVTGDEYGEYNHVRGERFGAHLPASAAVQVACLVVIRVMD